MALLNVSDTEVQKSLNVGGTQVPSVTRVFGGKNIVVNGATLQPVINFNVLNANAQNGNIAFYDTGTGTFVCDTAGNLYWDASTDVLHANNLKVNTNLNLGDGTTPSITDAFNLTGTSGQVLTALGSTSGVRWQSPVAGVTSIGGGSNITITGTSAVPIVSLSLSSLTAYSAGNIPFFDPSTGKLTGTSGIDLYYANADRSLLVNRLRLYTVADNTNSTGLSGQVLTANGASGVNWATPSGVGVVGAGRNIILTGTSASPTINLTTAITDSATLTGSANQILTAGVSGGTLTWANPADFLTAGTGISFSPSVPTVIGNTGILSITSGVGISSTGGQNPTLSVDLNAGSGVSVAGNTITNTGVITITAGTGITAGIGSSPTVSVDLTAGTGIGVAGATISNTGQLATVAGSGISVSTSLGTATVSNTGVIGIIASTGLSAVTVAGTTTLTNTGVVGITAGTGISVTSSLGIYTINAIGSVNTVVAGTNMGACTLVSGTLTINGSLTPSFTSATISGASTTALVFSGTNGGITMNSATPSINMGGSGASINITDIGTGTKLGITSGNIVLTNGYIQPRYIYDSVNSTLSGSSAYVLTSLGASGWKWSQPPYSVFAKTASNVTLTTATSGTAQFSTTMTYALSATNAPITLTGALYFNISSTPIHPSTCVVSAVILRAGSVLTTLPLVSSPTVGSAQAYAANFSAPITYRDTTGVAGTTYTYTVWVYYTAIGTVIAPAMVANSAIILSANS